MLLMYRMFVTNGDMISVLPIMQEIVSIVRDTTGVPIHAWSGSNGYVAGTTALSVAYDSLAARATAMAKLSSSKVLGAANQKLRKFTLSSDPDVIYQYVRGGSLGPNIPVGTIAAEVQLQLAQGDDWLATFKWANEFAELCKETTGVETHVMHSIFGVLGALRMLTGFDSATAADQHRVALDANPMYLAKFFEGTKYAVTGSVTQRHLIKIA